VIEVRTLKSLTASGVRLGALLACVKKVRAEIASAGARSLAATRLVTDGQLVFRYHPNDEKLEQMDEFGQFAFAFGLGSEIKSLVEQAEKLDRRSRYTRNVFAAGRVSVKQRKSV
jgi:hypothetical protein